MDNSGESTPALFTQVDTGEYVAYEPPAQPSFNETLPEDIRENEHLTGVEDNATLARYYVDLKKDHLRAPETPDGYEFEKPEGFNATDEEISQYKAMAHEEGINQKQFDRLMRFNVDTQAKSAEKLTQMINDKQTASEAELKTEWGDNYEKNIESAKSILNHESVADEEFKKFLEDTRFGDHPQVVKMFSKLSGLISQDVFKKPGNGNEAPQRPVGEDGKPMLKFPSMEGK